MPAKRACVRTTPELADQSCLPETNLPVQSLIGTASHGYLVIRGPDREIWENLNPAGS
ncbi:MAG TPA: hypothetical protein VGN12_01515 [Pirellulales bacterium]|jgi:hypothetical protein